MPSLNRQQPTQPGGSSATESPEPQSLAADADAENMAHLKAMAAQADRLMQVDCLLHVPLDVLLGT